MDEFLHTLVETAAEFLQPRFLPRRAGERITPAIDREVSFRQGRFHLSPSP
jgi:hypothetical protein